MKTPVPVIRRLLAVLAALAAACALTIATPGLARPARAATLNHKVFHYGDGPQQTIDTYWHHDAIAKPIIVFIHGGYLTGGSADDWDTTAQTWAKRGYIGASLAYPLVSATVSWQQPYSDVAAAITFIKGHFTQGDPDKIVAYGSSSGGYLASLAGTYGDGNARVAAVVSLSGPQDTTAAYNDGHTTNPTASQLKLADAVQTLAGGCTPSSCPPTYHDDTVTSHVDDRDAPELLVCSDQEFVTCAHQALPLAAALEAHDDAAWLITVPGTKHATKAVKNTPGLQGEINNWIDRQVGM